MEQLRRLPPVVASETREHGLPARVRLAIDIDDIELVENRIVTIRVVIGRTRNAQRLISIDDQRLRVALAFHQHDAFLIPMGRHPLPVEAEMGSFLPFKTEVLLPVLMGGLPETQPHDRLAIWRPVGEVDAVVGLPAPRRPLMVFKAIHGK